MMFTPHRNAIGKFCRRVFLRGAAEKRDARMSHMRASFSSLAFIASKVLRARVYGVGSVGVVS